MKGKQKNKKIIDEKGGDKEKKQDSFQFVSVLLSL